MVSALSLRYEWHRRQLDRVSTGIEMVARIVHTSGGSNVGSAHSLRLLLVLLDISIDRRQRSVWDSSYLEGGVAGVGGRVLV